MATEKYPNQNVNMPMSDSAVAAARARMGGSTQAPPPSDYVPPRPPQVGSAGGSRRETSPGMWIDDRVVDFDKPPSPSADTPPELPAPRAVPGSYDPLKAYNVTLGKTVPYAGRMLSPAKEYLMKGATCTEITTKDAAAIVDAVEAGDIPIEPDSPPS